MKRIRTSLSTQAAISWGAFATISSSTTYLHKTGLSKVVFTFETERWPRLTGQVGGVNKVESHRGYAACTVGRLE